MARPAGTYVSQVFNFGVDKNIPLGFVDVVFDRSGNAVGFEKNGKFYNLGEQVDKAPAKPLDANQLSKKVDILERKLNLARDRASNTNIPNAERNRYINDYRKTADEITKTQKDLLEAQIREGKIKEQTANDRAAEIIRFDIRNLEERKSLLTQLGQPVLEIDNQIRGKRSELDNIINPEVTQLGTQPNVVPTATRPFGAGQVPGMKGLTGPIAGGVEVEGTGIAGAGTAGAATAGTATSAGATGGKGGKGGKDEETPKLSAEERYANAIAKAQELYNMPDIIFKNVDSLGRLLKRYVNNELTDAQFVREIQNDAWYRTNSDEIKARYVQLFNYEDLVKTGRAQGTTNYEQEIDRITRSVQAEARRMRGVEVDDADARAIAKDLYIFNLDKDASIIRERIARFIKPVAGMIGGQLTEDYGGEALKNYQALQSLAKSNGFKLEDILPKDALGKPLNAQSTLQALATGKLDITRVAQDVRKLAAVGQSDFVKELLGQGFNLSDVYAPYKRRMATILELPEDQIDLRDPALQMAIGKQGDMNIFDYEKMLRNDNRWSYTKQAREEVTNAASAILRNFGFVG